MGVMSEVVLIYKSSHQGHVYTKGSSRIHSHTKRIRPQYETTEQLSICLYNWKAW